MSVSPEALGAETGTGLWLRAQGELKEALDALQAAQTTRREALRTMQAEGCSYREMVQRTGLSLGTISTLLAPVESGRR